MGREEDEKGRIVPTVWDRFDKLESQIAELKESDLEREEHIQRLEGCVSDCQEEINELKEHNHPEIIGKKEIYNLDFINKRLEEVLLNILKVFNDEYFCDQEWYDKQLKTLNSNIKTELSFETKGYISLKLSRKVDLVKLDALIHSIHRRAIRDVIDLDSFVWQDFSEVLLKADGSWDKRPEFYHKYDITKHIDSEGEK